MRNPLNANDLEPTADFTDFTDQKRQFIAKSPRSKDAKAEKLFAPSRLCDKNPCVDCSRQSIGLPSD
jgi:hypothetical protein